MSTSGLKVVERRARPRVETKVKVRLGDHSETFVGNLSKTGIFIETNESLASKGQRVRLDITLPHATDPVRVQGKVVRTTGPHRVGRAPGIAVEFLRIEARQVRTFERLIDRLLDARGIGSRKYPRVNSRLVVRLGADVNAKKTITENVSKGGLFIATPIDGFVLGDAITVVLIHPRSKRTFEANGKVVHLRKGSSLIVDDFVEGIGVKLELSSSRRTELQAFLKSVLSARRSKSK